MRKTYKIEVDCANCANLMEETVKKVDGIAHAVVNFIAQKLIVEFEDGADECEVMHDALKKCKKIDSDFEIEI